MSTVSNIKDGMQVALDLASAANRAGDVAKLIATQQQMLDILEENRSLRDKVAALEDELAIESQLRRKGFEYFVVESDDSGTGPVCPGCYRRDRVVSKLVGTGMGGGSKVCSRCHEYYSV